MLKLHNIFNNNSHLTKDYSTYLKTTEKSIETLGKNRNISLDFSNTPIKQNKKVIKRNTRTNSFNSLIINQTEGGFYPPYSYMTRINPNKNTKNSTGKGFLGMKGNHQKNKSFNIKKGIFNLNKQNMILKKKTQKKKCKRNFLNSYFINPNNVHISFNTVGNNFQIESQHSKQNIKSNNMLNSNNMNNKQNNISELNKSISNVNISKIKSNHKKININGNNTNNINNTNVSNEFMNIINKLSEEKQKLFLNEFKLYLNILNKIKKNKNNNDIIINESDFEEIKNGGIIGHILTQNFKFKQKNEQLESKLNNIMNELEEIKKDKKETKKELESKDKIIKELSNKIDMFNEEMIKMKNVIFNMSNKSKKDNEFSFCNKNSQGDLENISLADNSNINEELYNNKLNKNKNVIKQMKRNQSGKLLKTKEDVGNLNFSNKVGGFNFNDEFLKNYEYFSDSWRKEADKMLQRRGIKLNNQGGK